MSPLFADSAFFIAYLSPGDEQHRAACEYMAEAAHPIVTTTWVLAEVGNFLSAGPGRRMFMPLVRGLRSEKRFTIVEADKRSFDRGLRLYDERPDKGWSIVDCISFTVMRSRRMRKALTSDHHFEQAGFDILLA